MTIREHLRDTHEQLAKHHIAMAKGHKQLAKCFGSMEKAEGMESASDISEAHEGLAEQHIELSEFHLQCCKTLLDKVQGGELSKADMDRDLIQPDGISGIIGEVPQNVHPVFRSGQRDFGKATDGVDAVLAKTIFNDEI
jgi:hypothetical protein